MDNARGWWNVEGFYLYSRPAAFVHYFHLNIHCSQKATHFHLLNVTLSTNCAIIETSTQHILLRLLLVLMERAALLESMSLTAPSNSRLYLHLSYHLCVRLLFCCSLVCSLHRCYANMLSACNLHDHEHMRVSNTIFLNAYDDFYFILNIIRMRLWCQDSFNYYTNSEWDTSEGSKFMMFSHIFFLFILTLVHCD